MSTDDGLTATREVRERISRQFGNDPRRLVEYYIEYQAQFSERLLWRPDVPGEEGRASRRAAPNSDEA